ncbi:MAG: hypothetical protein EBU90_02515 [Proteobacteria bacterium]|nr:hypothetical protein [Pseudomonadota bacterium]NBP13109.1 hypothetical protein [bacterium]
MDRNISTINNFLDTRENLDWYIFQCGLPWIKLDLKVPYKEMYREAYALKSKFVEYRESNSKGWKSLCIHGLSSDQIYDYTSYPEYKNIDQNLVPYKWTEVSEACPVTTSFLKNSFFNAKFFRVRFMLLEPGGYILPHTDMPKKILAPINIALSNPQGCEFKMKGYGIVPFKPGNALMLDTSNEHIVYNNSNKPRIHLILHVNYPVLSDKSKTCWASLLYRSYQKANQA